MLKSGKVVGICCRGVGWGDVSGLDADKSYLDGDAVSVKRGCWSGDLG